MIDIPATRAELEDLIKVYERRFDAAKKSCADAEAALQSAEKNENEKRVAKQSADEALVALNHWRTHSSDAQQANAQTLAMDRHDNLAAACTEAATSLREAETVTEEARKHLRLMILEREKMDMKLDLAKTSQRKQAKLAQVLSDTRAAEEYGTRKAVL